MLFIIFTSGRGRLGRPFDNVIHLIWSLVSNNRCAIASKTNCAAAISTLFARTQFNQRSKLGFNSKKTIKKVSASEKLTAKIICGIMRLFETHPSISR